MSTPSSDGSLAVGEPGHGGQRYVLAAARPSAACRRRAPAAHRRPPPRRTNRRSRGRPGECGHACRRRSVVAPLAARRCGSAGRSAPSQVSPQVSSDRGATTAAVPVVRQLDELVGRRVARRSSPPRRPPDRPVRARCTSRWPRSTPGRASTPARCSEMSGQLPRAAPNSASASCERREVPPPLPAKFPLAGVQISPSDVGGPDDVLADEVRAAPDVPASPGLGPVERLGLRAHVSPPCCVALRFRHGYDSSARLPERGERGPPARVKRLLRGSFRRVSRPTPPSGAG